MSGLQEESETELRDRMGGRGVLVILYIRIFAFYEISNLIFMLLY